MTFPGEYASYEQVMAGLFCFHSRPSAYILARRAEETALTGKALRVMGVIEVDHPICYYLGRT